MSSLRSYLLGVTREYEMVLSMYRALVNIGSACDSGEYVGVIGAALVESILKRSRNLTRFFGIARDRRYKDVVYYLMYLRRGGAREFRRRVRACSGYEYTQRILREVNKYVVHLVRDGVGTRGGAVKGRDGVVMVVGFLCCVFSVFTDYIDVRVVGDDVVDRLRGLTVECNELGLGLS